jgi:hypothetical protein
MCLASSIKNIIENIKQNTLTINKITKPLLNIDEITMGIRSTL